MGSGISLSREQIIQIIKYELKNNFNKKMSEKIRFTDDGYEIHENFDDEEEYIKKLRIINYYLSEHK